MKFSIILFFSVKLSTMNHTRKCVFLEHSGNYFTVLPVISHGDKVFNVRIGLFHTIGDIWRLLTLFPSILMFWYKVSSRLCGSTLLNNLTLMHYCYHITTWNCSIKSVSILPTSNNKWYWTRIYVQYVTICWLLILLHMIQLCMFFQYNYLPETDRDWETYWT